ncbi:MAG: hypothetical protein M1308_12205 [Actinobacteria bacterium]|nr:hypothetical protein [Actinomycetota bacterium]
MNDDSEPIKPPEDLEQDQGQEENRESKAEQLKDHYDKYKDIKEKFSKEGGSKGEKGTGKGVRTGTSTGARTGAGEVAELGGTGAEIEAAGSVAAGGTAAAEGGAVAAGTGAAGAAAGGTAAAGGGAAAAGGGAAATAGVAVGSGAATAGVGTVVVAGVALTAAALKSKKVRTAIIALLIIIFLFIFLIISTILLVLGAGQDNKKRGTGQGSANIIDQNGGSVTPTPGGGGVGTCQVATSGPCAVSNLLGYFGDITKATNASMICNAESGGDPSSQNLGCLTGRSADYSIGLFQINMLAHCPGAFSSYSLNPPSCTIGDQAVLDNCVNTYLDPAQNIQYAVQLSRNGTDWSAWSTASTCGLTGGGNVGGLADAIYRSYGILMVGFDDTHLQWALAKLQDVSRTRFISYVSGVTIYASSTSYQADNNTVYLQQFAGEALFDLIMIHELGHVIRWRTSMDVGQLTQAIVSEGYLTYYSQNASSCTGSDNFNEDYAEMIAYYLNPNAGSQTARCVPAGSPNPYWSGGHPMHYNIALDILGTY